MYLKNLVYGLIVAIFVGADVFLFWPREAPTYRIDICLPAAAESDDPSLVEDWLRNSGERIDPETFCRLSFSAVWLGVVQSPQLDAGAIGGGSYLLYLGREAGSSTVKVASIWVGADFLPDETLWKPARVGSVVLDRPGSQVVVEMEASWFLLFPTVFFAAVIGLAFCLMLSSVVERRGPGSDCHPRPDRS